MKKSGNQWKSMKKSGNQGNQGNHCRNQEINAEIEKSQLKSGDFEITYTFLEVSDPSGKIPDL